jgi:hypothetical protein
MTTLASATASLPPALASFVAVAAPHPEVPAAERIVGLLLQKMKEAIAARQPVAGSVFEACITGAKPADVDTALWALQTCGYQASTSTREDGQRMLSLHC